MKILKLESEKPELGRKPKTPRVNHRLLEKIGQSLYHLNGVKDIKIQVGMTSGSIISYNRCEEDDEFEEFKKRRREKDEE